MNIDDFLSNQLANYTDEQLEASRLEMLASPQDTIPEQERIALGKLLRAVETEQTRRKLARQDA